MKTVASQLVSQKVEMLRVDMCRYRVYAIDPNWRNFFFTEVEVNDVLYQDLF